MSENKTNNLWEIVEYEDLLKFLRKSKGDNHLMLVLTLKKTSNENKKLLKQFINAKYAVFL
jgi:hypothetical protein